MYVQDLLELIGQLQEADTAEAVLNEKSIKLSVPLVSAVCGGNVRVRGTPPRLPLTPTRTPLMHGVPFFHT